MRKSINKWYDSDHSFKNRIKWWKSLSRKRKKVKYILVILLIHQKQEKEKKRKNPDGSIVIDQSVESYRDKQKRLHQLEKQKLKRTTPPPPVNVLMNWMIICRWHQHLILFSIVSFILFRLLCIVLTFTRDLLQNLSFSPFIQSVVLLAISVLTVLRFGYGHCYLL